MEKFDLDQPLLEFLSVYGRTPFTMRMACEGVGITGSIGSGKSSGSARLFALKMLEHGLGGLVLCAKNSEKKDWIEFCELTGRENDLVILEPNGKDRFNFMDYMGSHNTGTGLTENIVDVLQTVIEASENTGSNATGDNFWSGALTMVLFFSVQLCKYAYGTVSIETLHDICQSLPKEGERITPTDSIEPTAFFRAFNIVRERTKQKVGLWEKTYGKERIPHLKAINHYNFELYNVHPEIRQIKQMDDFFLHTYRKLADKTRSIVNFTIDGFLFRFLQEPVFSIFCNGTSTITPEMCATGKIILLNMPEKEFHKIGKDCQVMMKLIFQRAMEKRDVLIQPKPVFLYADEAQLFLHKKDTDFQATARSSRIITCFITQNIPNLIASMGGDKAEERVKAFLSTLGTKIFHSNSCMETNTFSSNLIGEAFMPEYSENVTFAERPSESRGTSLKLQKKMRPEDFVNLKTGGKIYSLMVEGIMHCQGAAKFFGENFLKVTFFQEHKPNRYVPKNIEPITDTTRLLM